MLATVDHSLNVRLLLKSVQYLVVPDWCLAAGVRCEISCWRYVCWSVVAAAAVEIAPMVVVVVVMRYYCYPNVIDVHYCSIALATFFSIII